MKAKVLLIAAATLVTAGIAMHTGKRNQCPFNQPCKLFNSQPAVKSGKALELQNVEATRIVMK